VSCVLFEGDSLTLIHLGQKFSTRDQDNDMDPSDSCGMMREGGWWFQECYDVYLNSVYSSVVWYTWKVNSYTLKSIKFTEMKIRPSDGEYFILK